MAKAKFPKGYVFKSGDVVEVNITGNPCHGRKATVKHVYGDPEFKRLTRNHPSFPSQVDSMLIDFHGRWPAGYEGIRYRGYWIQNACVKLIKSAGNTKTIKTMAKGISKKMSAGKTQNRKFFVGDRVQHSTSSAHQRRAHGGWTILGFVGDDGVKPGDWPYNAAFNRPFSGNKNPDKGMAVVKKYCGSTYDFMMEKDLDLVKGGKVREKQEKMTRKEKIEAKKKEELKSSMQKIQQGSAEAQEAKNKLTGLLGLFESLAKDE